MMKGKFATLWIATLILFLAFVSPSLVSAKTRTVKDATMVNYVCAIGIGPCMGYAVTVNGINYTIYISSYTQYLNLSKQVVSYYYILPGDTIRAIGNTSNTGGVWTFTATTVQDLSR